MKDINTFYFVECASHMLMHQKNFYLLRLMET